MTRLVAILAYYTGLDRLFYWLNRRAKRILTFHNVLPDELFARNIANGVSCSASEFRTVIRELKRKWKFSTDLFDPATVTITFDDGYLNQYEVAADILKGSAALCFVLFGLIGYLTVSKDPVGLKLVIGLIFGMFGGHRYDMNVTICIICC